MMSDLNAVFDVLESDDSASELGLIGDGFSRWKDMFEYLYYSQSKLGCESFEDQMWIGFADGSFRAVRNIQPQDYIV